MNARAVCAIDLDAVAHNLREVRRVVGEHVRICAVVKANAYGHGAVPVSRALARAGASFLAVASLDEARPLREAGLALPILVLQGIAPDQAGDASRLGVTPVVWSAAALRAIVAALPAGARVPIHLKIDTGMHRSGAALDDVAELARTAREVGADVEGVLSHLACADEPGHPSLEQQRERFESALAELARHGIRPRLRHFASSASLLGDSSTFYDMVRPGLLLYGCLPSPVFAGRIDLRPVMELSTRVVQVKTVPAGGGVGYNRTFVADRETRLAVLPIGYGQGYPRALSNSGSVMIRGKLSPVVGTISMDYMTIDVTEVEGAQIGDQVVLWGGTPDVMSLGAAAGTIGYELLVGVGADVPRVYRGEGS